MYFVLENEKAEVKERTSLLYASANAATIMSALCFSFLSFLLLGTVNQALLTGLWATMIIICIARIIDVQRTAKNIGDNDQCDHIACIGRFSLGILATAVVWAVFTILFMQQMSLVQLSLTATVLSGLAGGSITVLGPLRFVASTFMTLLILPFSLNFLSLGFTEFYGISGLGIGFWMILIMSAKRASELISTSVKLKVDNNKLIEQIQEEKNALEISNSQLTKVNTKLDNYSIALQDEVNKRTDEIFRISNLDTLTQLLNRAALLANINKDFSEAYINDTEHTLFFIDLSGFKGINDSFGHAHGDIVLKIIAQRLRRFADMHCIDANPHVCRWGGDEFIFIYEAPKKPICKINYCLELANEMSKCIAQRITIDIDSVMVDSSIGIAHYPDDSTEPLELIQFADLAMYDTKSSAANIPQQYTSNLLANYVREQLIRRGLYAAVANYEFFLVFQPIVDLVKERTDGFETLLRWEHKGQLISPEEFVPIAEKTGLIKSIGIWVIERSILEFASIDGYKEYNLSINLSRIQLLDDECVDRILQIISKSPVRKERLFFEVTETSSIEDQDKFHKNIKRIADSGACISIDDFGTGYSSLQELQHLAFDVLKIDRAFIENLNDRDIAVVTAAGFIAKQFNAKVIIEGIESQEQVEKLKTLGFRYIQGYLFSKPLRINQIQEWLNRAYAKA